MKQKLLGDTLIAGIIDAVNNSNAQDKINCYIEEVAENCAALCRRGEHLRVLNEYKILIDNIRKEINF